MRGNGPEAGAAYVAALATLHHPDEGGAREILAALADEGDAGTLWKLVGAFGRFANNRTNPGDGGRGDTYWLNAQG